MATSDMAKEASLGAIAAGRASRPTTSASSSSARRRRTRSFRAPPVCCRHKIGATRAWGFDLGAACSGFTYALTTGMQMVATGAHDYALVVGADTMSSIIDYRDRTTCVLFGDGAGAVGAGAGGRRRAGDHRFRARDRRHRRSGAVHAGRRQPACRRRTRPSTSGCTTSSRTDRRSSSSPCARPRKSRGGCSSATASTRPSIDLFVSHQANRRIISAAAERLGLPESKVVINLERFGNTTAATIPLALADAVADKRLKRGRPRAAGVGRRRLHGRLSAAPMEPVTRVGPAYELSALAAPPPLALARASALARAAGAPRAPEPRAPEPRAPE